MGIVKVNPDIEFRSKNFFKDVEKSYWQTEKL